jgi:glycosyltransferase involved in cell wall biosynthesis
MTVLPPLSVVLPTHDRPTQVLEAARSVLDQNIPTLQLIVVDDGSTAEGCSRSLERLADDPNVRIVRNETALGLPRARNCGIAVAENDHIGFCDDDDLWRAGAADVLLRTLTAHPKAAVASSWHEVVHKGADRTVVHRGPLRFGAEELLWQNFVGVPFGIVDRSRLSQAFRYDPEFPTGEDWDLWIRCARESPFLMVPAVLYSYSQHHGPRLTTDLTRLGESRRRILAKYGGEMTPLCRTFHELVLTAQLDGPTATTKAVARRIGAQPFGALGAESLLTLSYVASHMGMRRSDPGLAPRVMAKAVRLARPRQGSSGRRRP